MRTLYWRFFGDTYKIYTDAPEIIKFFNKNSYCKKHSHYYFNQKFIAYDYIISEEKLSFIRTTLKSQFSEKLTPYGTMT